MVHREIQFSSLDEINLAQNEMSINGLMVTVKGRQILEFLSYHCPLKRDSDP
jgi:hypothetical protein